MSKIYKKMWTIFALGTITFHLSDITKCYAMDEENKKTFVTLKKDSEPLIVKESKRNNSVDGSKINEDVYYSDQERAERRAYAQYIIKQNSSTFWNRSCWEWSFWTCD